MHLVLEKGDPREHREELIRLFERNGDQGLFRLAFDWYLQEGGLGRTHTWFLWTRNRGELVGFCSVVSRTFSRSGHKIRVGILTNLLVLGEGRSSLGGLSLVRAAQSLVRRSEVDLLLHVPSPDQAQGQLKAFLMRMGFERIDDLGTFAVLFRSRRLLHSRWGLAGTAISPLVDMLAALRHWLFAPWRSSHKHLQIVELSSQELDNVPIEDWPSTDNRIVEAPSADHLRRRYLQAPVRAYRVLGLADVRSKNEICGYVVVTYDSGKVLVWDCRTDARRLGEAQAIVEVCRYWRGRSDVFSVGALRSSRLARELRAAGFARVPESTNKWCVLGFWLPSHPLAAQFTQPSQWNLFGHFTEF